MVQNCLEVVGAVIRGDIDGEPAVLAFRRSPHKAASGLWEFPGGKVEEDESPQEALARELYEELGVRFAIGGLVNRASTDVGERVIDLACYWATAGETPTESSDHDVIRWVRVADLREVEWAKPDLPAVAVIEDELAAELRGLR